jgi:hypothetical protein
VHGNRKGGDNGAAIVIKMMLNLLRYLCRPGLVCSRDYWSCDLLTGLPILQTHGLTVCSAQQQDPRKQVRSCVICHVSPRRPSVVRGKILPIAEVASECTTPEEINETHVHALGGLAHTDNAPEAG